MNKIKIDGKTYSYFLKRDSVYKFGKIIGKLNLDLKEIKNFNDIIIIIKMIQNAIFNFESTDKESMDFISSIYNIKKEEIEEKEFHKFELKLWQNLFRDKELVSFFSQVFKSKIKKADDLKK